MGRAFRLFALLLSLVLSCCTGGTSPPSSEPGEDSSSGAPALEAGPGIVFAADVDGGWDFYEGNADVFVMDANGADRRNLTNHPANDFSPEWSPDGSRIVFRTNRDGNHEIYVMNSDGTDPENLTRTDAEERSPAWSPDGSRIAFSSNMDGDRDIYVMDADGSHVQRLVAPGLDEYPTWSPDGSAIAFTSACEVCSDFSLYVMDADGSNRRLITDGAGWPDWSPDGRAIAFDSLARDGRIHIHVVDPRRDGVRRRVVRGVQADWSPDGRRLVYVVEAGRLHEEGSTLSGDIYVSRTDGGRARRLTDTPEVFEFEPSWEPR